jgi:hypothetical protein
MIRITLNILQVKQNGKSSLAASKEKGTFTSIFPDKAFMFHSLLLPRGSFSFDAAKDDLMAGNIIGAKIEGSALENSFKITKIKL